ncbi:hypothetical protein FQB35_10260 [Crassaminicella thermophila]|uniref:DUF4129 domain-containing protein n=1 Tax=Crassaminicella thermophila TaxID=2599308 RepID=A0A5C0SED3_CRATE|nr:hypothetical protein [Crassaminicella thermophila]QEK12681.1 hypothetical protein FQB35_10260 [Crassaminicella thermophila]
MIPKKEIFEKVVDKIIDSSKYMHLKQTENVFKKILERIFEILKKSLNKGYIPSNGSISINQNIFIIFGIFLIIVLFYYFFKSKSPSVVHKKIIYGETIDDDTTYESLYKKAISCEKEENYKDAVRLYFISMIFYMNEKSLCIMDKSKTNYEIINILKKKNFKGVKVFQDIGDYFYRIWYGNKKIHKEKFVEYKEKIDDLFMEVNKYNEKT